MIEIRKLGDKGYGFNLMAENGGKLLKSVVFSSEAEVEKSLAELNTLRNRHDVFERKTNHEGKFLFNLKNQKGRLIAKSQLYSSEAGMENGIKNVKNRIASLTNQNL